MNLKNDIKRFDERMHRWEHHMVLSGDKIVHNETFWLAVLIAFMVTIFVLAMIMGPKTAPPRNMFPTPFGPMY